MSKNYMNFITFSFLISTIFTSYAIIQIPYGLGAGSACRYYGYGSVIATTQNISYLYRLLMSYGYPSAYLEGYNGGFEGYVLTNTGAIQPYNKYSNPTYYSFCQTGRMMNDQKTDMPVAEQDEVDDMNTKDVNLSGNKLKVRVDGDEFDYSKSADRFFKHGFDEIDHSSFLFTKTSDSSFYEKDSNDYVSSDQ